MLELYAFLSLIGLGYLLSKKSPVIPTTTVSDNPYERPSQNNAYDSSYSTAVSQIEAMKAQQAVANSLTPNTTGVVSRNYRDQRDAAADNKTIKSNLAGIEIPEKDFQHNNMMPYFGSRVKQNVEPVANRSVLEKFTGEFGQDIYKKKREQAPLFDPMQRDLGNDIWGNKNRNDYYMDRMVEPRARNNERPFDQVIVGPGLNMGYTAAPTGGFQQFDTQDYAKPKTVDELRMGSNPKETYEGRVMPGTGTFQRGFVGDVKKHRADTYYENTPERYFTTVGAVTKETERPEEIIKDQNRQETTREYAGDPTAAGFSKAPTMEPVVKTTDRQQLEEFGFRNVDGGDYGKGDEYDYGKDNILTTENERDTTVTKTYEGNLTSLVKTIIAPLEDIFRSSRKEYSIQNPRLYGEFQATFPAKGAIKDPNDVARTTIKETNIHDTLGMGSMTGPSKGTVKDPNDVARTTIKETNIHDTLGMGSMKGPVKITIKDPNDVMRTTIKETNIHDTTTGNLKGAQRITVYDPDDVARTTVRQTTRPMDVQLNLGGATIGMMGTLPLDAALKTTNKETLIDGERYGNMDGVERTHGGYQSAEYDAKLTQKQFTSDNDYTGIANLPVDDGYLVAELDVKDTQKQFLSDKDYIGGAGTTDAKKPTSIEEYMNAEIDGLKEATLEGREPTQESVKVAVGADEVNQTTRKLEVDEYIERENFNYDRIYSNDPTKQAEGETTRGRFDLEADDRLDISVLSSLKTNPYAMKPLSA